MGENYGATGTLAILEGSTLNRDAGPGVVLCSGKVVSRHAADLRTSLFGGDSFLFSKSITVMSIRSVSHEEVEIALVPMFSAVRRIMMCSN